MYRGRSTTLNVLRSIVCCSLTNKNGSFWQIAVSLEELNTSGESYWGGGITLLPCCGLFSFKSSPGHVSFLLQERLIHFLLLFFLLLLEIV